MFGNDHLTVVITVCIILKYFKHLPILTKILSHKAQILVIYFTCKKIELYTREKNPTKYYMVYFFFCVHSLHTQNIVKQKNS